MKEEKVHYIRHRYKKILVYKKLLKQYSATVVGVHILEIIYYYYTRIYIYIYIYSVCYIQHVLNWEIIIIKRFEIILSSANTQIYKCCHGARL